MFPPKKTKMKKKDNHSVMNLTENILNRLNFQNANERLSQKHRESFPLLENMHRRKKKQPRKALNKLDCNSILMLENVNRIRLERMRKTIFQKKVFSPEVAPKKINHFILEFSEKLVKYLSAEDHRSGGKGLQFRKCMDQREVKSRRKDHFAVGNKKRALRKCKSVELQRKNLSSANVEQLFYILAQNKNNCLRMNKDKQKLLNTIQKKNPTIIYKRFSKKLINYLKLNLGKKLTGYTSDEDLVIRVRDTLRSKENDFGGMVVGGESEGSNERHHEGAETAEEEGRVQANQKGHLAYRPFYFYFPVVEDYKEEVGGGNQERVHPAAL